LRSLHYIVKIFPEPLCHQLPPVPLHLPIIRLVPDILLRDPFDVTKQSFLLDWAELEEVSAKYLILKSTEDPQPLVNLVEGVEAKHANFVDDQYFPASPPLLTSFVGHVILYLVVSVLKRKPYGRVDCIAADPDSRRPGCGRDDHSLCAFDRQHRLHSFDHPRFACTAAAPYILGMLPGSLGSLFRSS